MTVSTFALIVPRFEDILHSFYAGEIIKGVCLAASRLKVDIYVHISDRFEHKDWLSAPFTARKDIQGIIFADIDSDIETLQKVINTGVPYVVLNNLFAEPINSVAIDNRKAAFDVVTHLIDLGHTRIATITGDLLTQAGRWRLTGYKQALQEKDLPLRDEYMKVGDFLRSPARKAASELFALTERPTAVFAASDVMALELMAEAKAQGIRIPEQLSVVGFDDHPLAQSVSPKLSTVAQPIAEMGRLGMEHLYKIACEKNRAPLKVLLSTTYIDRESCQGLEKAVSK